MRTATLVVVGLACATSCHRVQEPEIEIDGALLCDQHCELVMECGLAENPYDDHEGCFNECTTPDAWTGDCAVEREEYVTCLVALTCEEFVASRESFDPSPCDDLSMAYGGCIARKNAP